ncbi:MAG: cytochrome d ubiquinol oxidase subunit II [Candidatus Eremiobacterota bacterium]
MLETIWFILWGLLWAVYFMLDGFDLGLGTLMPFLAKNEENKKIIYNSIGPFWDGNEVWLISAGGVTFAAFPKTYAVMFSSMYSALMLVLFALIIRGISIEFRGKLDHPLWKKIWDTGLVAGSFLPAVLLGVAFANIFQGIPIDGDGIYRGNLFTLLNPYGLLGGVFFLLLFLLHGSLWLAIKSEGELNNRAAGLSEILWVTLLVVTLIFLLVTKLLTGLFDNYIHMPVLFIIPLLTVTGLVLSRLFIYKKSWWKAWFSSCLTILSATFFGVTGLYPAMLPSSIDPSFSLTVYNSSSSPLTLKIMLVVALVFVPIVIIYQTWVYSLFKDKLEEKDLVY